MNHIDHSHVKGDHFLHVVSVISNPVRFHSRYRIAKKYIEAMAKTENVKLHIVEGVFGCRHSELRTLCEELGVDYYAVHTNSEIWIKENMGNIGIRRMLTLNPDARYIGFIDADVFFRDAHWAVEAVQQLQHFDIIQPWSDCVDLGFQGNVLQHFRSFGRQHQARIPKQKHPSQPYQYAHTGYAWCFTRRFYQAVSGLMDFPILGSADHHMAFACIGEVMDTVHGGMTDGFKRMAKAWQHRASQACKKEVGFIQGRIEHEWHGSKVKRYYRERWQILIAHQFNPEMDITYDEQGVIQLVGKPELEQDIRMYNRSRQEDDLS